MKKKIGTLESTFISFLSYYLGIMALPLLICIILFIYCFTITKSEFFNSNYKLLDQIKLSNDKKIEAIDKLATQIAYDNTSLNIPDSYDEISNSMHYTIMQKTLSFKSYLFSDNDINDFFVFMPNNSTILSPGGFYNLYDLNTTTFKHALWEIPNARLILSQFHKGNFLTITHKNTKDTKDILYIKSFRYAINPSSYITTVIKINNNSITTPPIFHKYNSLSYFQIFTKDGTPILKTDNNIFQGLNIHKISKDHITSLSGKPYYINIASSSISDWTYVMAIPSSSINNHLVKICLIGVIGLICIITASLFIIIKIKKVQYMPFLSTIKLLKNSSEPLTSSQSYKFLQEAVQNTLVNESHMKLNIEKNKAELKNYFLTRLLNGDVNDDECSSLLYFYDIDFTHDCFNVVVLYPSTYSVSTSFKSEYINLANSIQNSYYEEFRTLCSSFSIYPVIINGSFIFILNYTPSTKSNNCLKEWLSKFSSKLKELDIHIGISSNKANPIELSCAYRESLRIVEANMLYNDYCIEQYYDGIISNKIVDHKYYQYEKNFEIMLENKDYDKARDIIENLYNLILKQKNMNTSIVKFKMSGITNILINHIEALNLKSQIDASTYDTLLAFNDLARLNKCILDILATLKKTVPNDNGDISMEKLMHYIQNHFSDDNLSVSFLADKLNIDISALSKKFKKYTSNNLSDYIQKMRINKSKDLLVQSKLTIKEISIKCGYSNSDSFIKVFRRYEGITPGKYRSNPNLSL